MEVPREKGKRGGNRARSNDKESHGVPVVDGEQDRENFCSNEERGRSLHSTEERMEELKKNSS